MHVQTDHYPKLSAIILVIGSLTLNLVPIQNAHSQHITEWQNSGTGDWHDPSNWSNGLPEEQSEALVNNGGTIRIMGDLTGPLVTRVGVAGSGTIEIGTGTWSRSFVELGKTSDTHGTLRIFGDAVLDILFSIESIGRTVIQEGGTWNNYELFAIGDHHHSGGRLNVAHLLRIGGGLTSFELSEVGQVAVDDLTILSNHATFTQSGGEFRTRNGLVAEDGMFRIEGGLAQIGSFGNQRGVVEVRGGELRVDQFSIGPFSDLGPELGRMIVSGGTFATLGGTYHGDVAIEFEPGPWRLDIQGGITQLATSSMRDVSLATLRTARNSITVLPAGVSLNDFAATDVQGVVTFAGMPITVPANASIAGSGDFNVPLIIAGQIVARDNPIYARNGIRVLPGALANLGTGTVEITDQNGGVQGGTLRTERLTIGTLGRPGHFVHDRGLVSVDREMRIGTTEQTTGSYDFRGGQIVSTDIIMGGKGTGDLVQTGGAAFTQVMYLGDQGEYKVDGGQLTVSGGLLVGGIPRESGAAPDHAARLTIVNGSVTAYEVSIGRRSVEKGIVRFTGGRGELAVTSRLLFGVEAIVEAARGAQIRLQDAAVVLESTDPVAMRGLNNVALTFDNQPGSPATLEIASRDIGLSPAGYVDNFALWSLVVGVTRPSNASLIDQVMNSGNRDSLYVRHLTVGPNSTLRLNGTTVYYETLNVAPTASIIAGGGRLLMLIPEPTGLATLAVGSMLLFVGLRPPRKFTA